MSFRAHLFPDIFPERGVADPVQMFPKVTHVRLAGSGLGDVGHVLFADRADEVPVHGDIFLSIPKDGFQLLLEMGHHGGRCQLLAARFL